MRKYPVLVAACAASLSACSLDIPDLDHPGLDQLEKNPTRANISAAAIGLLIGNRGDVAEPNGYVSILGILGRESYNFDVADDRFITELLASAHLDPGSPRFGGNFWNAPYRNLRHGNVLLRALDRAGVLGVLSPEEIRATAAFARTIQALDYLVVINTRDSNGAVVDVDRERGAELAPIVGKAEVLAHISLLLDAAYDELARAGSAFPFQLPSGFGGFDAPTSASFGRFNRAIQARVAVYRGAYGDALAALEGSFLTVAEDAPALDLGVYYTFAGTSGDRLNGLVDPNLFVHPAVVAEAERKADGDPDDRVQAKVFEKEARRLQMLESRFGFARYQNPRAPVPIIRNEELILLRAEALMRLRRFEEAALDLNFIRRHSGGLEPRGDLGEFNLIDELLQQRRYSLLFEGGHRWIDMRRLQRLQLLPLDVPGHTVHTAFPIPVAETDPR